MTKINQGLKVTIDNQQANVDNVESRSGTKNGRDWSMRSQNIWVYEDGAQFPLKVQYVLPDRVQVYPAGEYTLDLNKGFTTGNFNSLLVDTRRLQLVPVLPKS